MPQDWFSDNAPKAQAAAGPDWFASNAPATQEPQRPPAQAQTRTWADSASDFAKGFIDQVNPLPGLKALYDHPLDTLEGLGHAQVDQFRKGKQAYDEGRYSEAFGHTLAGALPLVGPAAANIGDTIGAGKVAEGLGGATALLVPFGVKAARDLHAAHAATPAAAITPASRAIQFADEEQIPLTAGNRTGNKVIQNVEGLVQNAPGGSGYAAKVRAAQAGALTDTGERLANDVRPGAAVTAESAGNAVQQSLKDRIANLKGEADQAYGTLRQIESRPEHWKTVQVGTTTENAASHYEEALNQSVEARLASMKDMVDSGATENVGRLRRAVNPDNPHDLGPIEWRIGGGFKVIFPELNGFNESPSRLVAAIDRPDSKLGQQIRSAVKNVVEDEEGPDIKKALQDAGVSDESKPGVRTVPVMRDIAMPVDMRPVKSTLKPIYDEMRQQMPIAQQQASVGLKAIENVLSGKDYVPASVADRALGAIKSIARTDNPNLRNINQGLAAKVVSQMETAVQQAVNEAGPKATSALLNGRMATKAKYATADLLSSLPEEPVKLFNKLTTQKDASINTLRDVAKMAPSELPHIGRAYVEGLLDSATAEGGFQKAGTLLNQWNKLGQETKRLLVPDPQTAARLDNFFLLAKKIGEVPNPSGSAYVGQLVANGVLLATEPHVAAGYFIGNAALSRILFNPRTAKLLTDAMRTPLASAATVARATSALSQLLTIIGDDAQPIGASRGPQTAMPELAPAQ